MGFIVAVSAFIIPLIIFYVVVDGIIHQTDVYDVFVEGAKDGMKTVGILTWSEANCMVNALSL